MNRASMDRFIDTIEWIAAGFVGIVAANIFISVLLRNTLNYAIPDSFDIGRMLLGILIFWGIAATSYRGGHITVDLVWANVGPKYQRIIDVFATLVLLFVVTVQTWTLFDKVRGTYNDNVLTFDLHMPAWPFFAIAWAGDVSAVVLIAIRTYRLIFYPDLMHDPKIKTAEQGDEHRRRRRPRTRRAVRADAAAGAGRHGNGPRRRHRIRLSRWFLAGTQAGRPDLDAHGDRLHLRRDSDVPADGHAGQQFRHEPRTVPRRQRFCRSSARRARDCDGGGLRRLCRDLRLVG